MRLPCWNVTRGAFAVIRLFCKIEVLRLEWLVLRELPFRPFWFETVAVSPGSACLLP